MSDGLSLAMAWRIARRDLSGRFRGLRLLLVCLFLGVGALAAIGTLTGAIERELATRGRAILGGDLEIEIWQRALTADERQALSALGRVEEGVRLQAMVTHGGDAVPVELKAVGPNWPMVGRLVLRDGRRVGAPPEGIVWLADSAAARLGVGPGDAVRVGGQAVTVGGLIADEPDRLSEGLSFGAPAIVARGLPDRAGLLAPGAMYRTKARVALESLGGPDAVVEGLRARFPKAGFSVRTRDNAAPGAERFVSRMGEFLTLIGLAALIIAGIGIGGGVTSYLEARRGSIATLKVLGAKSGDIAIIYLMQIAATALAGSLAGLVAGAAVTPLIGRALVGLLPVAPGFVLDGGALLSALAFGLLVALIFAAPPLLRARETPAMALMRAHVSSTNRPGRPQILTVGAGVFILVALALARAEQIRVTALFLAGAAGVLLLLWGLGRAIRAGAAALPRPGNPLLRAGLANLHRPGAQTGSLVTALGFGLSAFVMLAAVQSSLEANIARRVPNRAPDYFVLDLPRAQEAAFKAVVAETAPGAKVRTVPTLRGAILAYGPAGRQTQVTEALRRNGGNWTLRGERGLTYADRLPEGNSLTAGTWWPASYTGAPLVSVDEEMARALGLNLGDHLTIGLLGVERTARIANFRRIDWDSMGFNYALVFSPNAIADAPHNLAATVDVPAGVEKGPLLRRLVRAYPSSAVIETRTLLEQARGLLDQMGTAILSAASVTILAGLVVLFGAIAAARASRLYDSIILRVLGASRAQLLLLQLAEYGALALLLAAVALVLGSGIAWLIIVEMFGFDWLPDWPVVLATLAAGITLVTAFALAGSLTLLRAKPAQALRAL